MGGLHPQLGSRTTPWGLHPQLASRTTPWGACSPQLGSRTTRSVWYSPSCAAGPHHGGPQPPAGQPRWSQNTTGMGVCSPSWAAALEPEAGQAVPGVSCHGPRSGQHSGRLAGGAAIQGWQLAAVEGGSGKAWLRLCGSRCLAVSKARPAWLPEGQKRAGCGAHTRVATGAGQAVSATKVGRLHQQCLCWLMGTTRTGGCNTWAAPLRLTCGLGMRTAQGVGWPERGAGVKCAAQLDGYHKRRLVIGHIGTK